MDKNTETLYSSLVPRRRDLVVPCTTGTGGCARSVSLEILSSAWVPSLFPLFE